MHRGQPLGLCPLAHGGKQAGTQGFGRQSRTAQQPRAAGWRERYGAQQLRKVLEPVLLEGARPGEIEHELAPGMGLAIERCGRGQSMRVKQGQVLRGPAAAGSGAAAVFERGQEFMTQERIVARQRVPLLGGYLGDAREDSALHYAAATGICSRYLSASSAAMQPEPAEVMAWR